MLLGYGQAEQVRCNVTTTTSGRDFADRSPCLLDQKLKKLELVLSQIRHEKLLYY